MKSSRSPIVRLIYAGAAILILALALSRFQDANDALRQEVALTEAQNRLLKDKLAAAKKSERETAESLTRDTSESLVSSFERRQRDVFATLERIFHDSNRVPPPFFLNGRTGRFFLELMDNPAYAQAADTVTRGQAEDMYGPWLRTLDLAPSVRARFSQMLLDTLMFDLKVEKAIQGRGLDSAEVLAEKFSLKTKLMRDFSTQGAGSVGDEVMKQLQVQTMLANTGGNPLQPIIQRLSYSEAPLTFQQTNRIYEMIPFPILMQAGVTNRKEGTKAFMEILVTQANSLLSPGQLAQVQEYVREAGVFPTTP